MRKFAKILIFGLLLAVSCKWKNEDRLKLNQIQVIGSHNSYKQSIDSGLLKLISNQDSAAASALSYAHRSLTDQLNLGLRNLEIDVYADSLGGRYAYPKGLYLTSQSAEYDSALMLQPGFKVFHIPDIDFRSSCLLFSQCLQEIKNWSDDHPGHEPVFITLEAKDQTKSRGELRITSAEDFTVDVFSELDQVIIENLSSEKLLTPDMVRGSFLTLKSAVEAQNWPFLDDCRGKFLFILDDAGRKRSAYLQLHPGLKNAVLFTNSPADSPEAAIMIINDSRDSRISELVQQAFIIRTRADANTMEARNDDYSTFESACVSGAQIISTDYYQKSEFFESDYHISYEENSYFRKNPLFHD